MSDIGPEGGAAGVAVAPGVAGLHECARAALATVAAGSPLPLDLAAGLALRVLEVAGDDGEGAALARAALAAEDAHRTRRALELAGWALAWTAHRAGKADAR
ncbi:MAG: hypothetical protein RID81_07310 [Sandaracinaceae bacterium]